MVIAKTNDGVGDIELPVAELKTIGFEALCNDLNGESIKLFEACCRDGIFYLDMAGTEPNISKVVGEIYALEEEIFNLAEEELMCFDIDKLSPRKLNGYKPLGRNYGELADNKDGFQSYALPKDGIIGLVDSSSFQRPRVVDLYMLALQNFTRAISTAASTILSQLSASLKLQPGETLQNIHRSQSSTPDLIRLLKYQAQGISERGASHIPHTDLGSLTFLFTRQPGLQIWSVQNQKWEWVRPREGYATVNVGDCLSLLVGKLFLSCRHRVSVFPGQAMTERYSFAYFLRPDDGTLMKAVTSPLLAKQDRQEKGKEEVFTSEEWMQRKYAMLRRETWTENDSWILTGA
ncbi:hypothetical protein MMC11_007440 [Xylographa trunciseda]|nr:hypothetical protein [Xylographa trunciseda]